MSDDLIHTVASRIKAERARMTDIEAEIARLRNAYGRAEAEVNRLQAFADTYAELMGVHAADVFENNDPPIDLAKRPKNPPREFVVDNALELIREAKRPLSRKEIFYALKDRGVIINGKDPEMVLSTMLWRDQERIVRLPNYGYWPKDVQYPRASYWPEFESVLGSSSKDPEDGIIADDEEE